MGLDLLTSQLGHSSLAITHGYLVQALNYQGLPAAWFDDDFWGVHFDIMGFVQHARQVMIVVPDQVHAAAAQTQGDANGT